MRIVITSPGCSGASSTSGRAAVSWIEVSRTRGSPTAASDNERLLRVYRTWRRATRPNWKRWLERSGFDDLVLPLLAVSFLVFWPIDGALWALPWPFTPHLPVPFLGPLSVAAMVAAAMLANGALLHLALSRAGADDDSWPLWLRRLRCVLAAIPLAGLLVVPGWRWVRKRHPGLAAGAAGREAAPTPAPAGGWLAPSRHAVTRLWGRLDFLWAAAWLFVGNLVVLFLAGCRLASTPAAMGGRRGLLALSVLLHIPCCGLAAAFAAWRCRRSHLRRWRRVAVTAASVCWLLPIPFGAVLGLLVWFAMGAEATRSEEIVHGALLRSDGAARLPQWIRLEDSLSHAWEGLSWPQRMRRPPRPLGGPADLGRAHGKVLALYELRIFALGLDAAAAAWAMGWLAARRPAWAATLGAVHGACWKAALTLCALTSIALALDTAMAILRIAGPRRLRSLRPHASAAAKAQLAALLGLWWGFELQRGARREVATTMMFGAALLLTLKAAALSLAPAGQNVRVTRHRLADELPDLSCLLGLEIAGGVELTSDVLSPLLAAWAICWPLVAVLLGRTHLPWQLRPLGWREIADRSLPPRLRCGLALLVLATVLPFGGLAVPACIATRRRLGPLARKLAWQRRRELGGVSGDGP